MKIGRPADLADKAKFSGMLVTFEADWFVGFEASYIDDRIWMDGMSGLRVTCKPPPLARNEIYTGRTYRVRVVGIAHTAGRYGHLGGADGLINAREIVYLDPKRPECQ